MSSAPPGRALRFHDVTSADGTRLRAWTNDGDGPTVLLCNGLGTNPHAWPALLRRDCGVRVVSWNHRGTGGSDRPADPDRIGVEAFVEDAIAVLDDAGVDRCVVAGWSFGVNTAFELAVLAPERVSGLFAVAGGRNIADEYFMLNMSSNFVDMDAFVAGAVVAQLQGIFDQYWNSDVVYPVQAIVAATVPPAQAADEFQRLSTVEHAPPELPPAVRSRFQGLRVGPKTLL